MLGGVWSGGGWAQAPIEQPQGSALALGGRRGAVPEQVLDVEVAPQLAAQDGNDGGDLGGGEAGLVEEEDESGDKLCPVGDFGIPGPVPGEPGGRR